MTSCHETPNAKWYYALAGVIALAITGGLSDMILRTEQTRTYGPHAHDPVIMSVKSLTKTNNENFVVSADIPTDYATCHDVQKNKPAQSETISTIVLCLPKTP